MPDEERHAQGLEVRRAVLGDDYVNSALSTADDFGREFQRLVTEYCWGAWAQEDLSLKQRSLNNLCILAALNRLDEFELHMRGAINNGCTVEEVRETLIQVAIYAGVPAGVGAFKRARKIYAEEGIDLGTTS
jgi:4-carboxymuconolactone decarboxylase